MSKMWEVDPETRAKVRCARVKIILFCYDTIGTVFANFLLMRLSYSFSKSRRQMETTAVVTAERLPRNG
jgi:hypothetical protein